VRAKAEAQALGVNLTVTGPTDFSASEQAPILNAVAVSKPDTLIVAPTDSSVLNPELSRIAGEGVKLVFVDTTTTDPSLAVSHITTNNVAGGALAADSLAQQIGGKGTVAVIDVNPGISTTDARIQGSVVRNVVALGADRRCGPPQHRSSGPARRGEPRREAGESQRPPSVTDGGPL
jgi:ribose transport system substrate-binding protein